MINKVLGFFLLFLLCNCESYKLERSLKAHLKSHFRLYVSSRDSYRIKGCKIVRYPQYSPLLSGHDEKVKEEYAEDVEPYFGECHLRFKFPGYMPDGPSNKVLYEATYLYLPLSHSWVFLHRTEAQ